MTVVLPAGYECPFGVQKVSEKELNLILNQGVELSDVFCVGTPYEITLHQIKGLYEDQGYSVNVLHNKEVIESSQEYAMALSGSSPYELKSVLPGLKVDGIWGIPGPPLVIIRKTSEKDVEILDVGESGENPLFTLDQLKQSIIDSGYSIK